MGVAARLGTWHRLLGLTRNQVARAFPRRNTAPLPSVVSGLVVHDGNGKKDRVTMLPRALKEPLRQHLARLRLLQPKGLAEGLGGV